MKEEFETWAKSRYMPLRVASSGEYWVETTQFAWEAWQASREELTVDFTPVRQEANNHCFGGEEAVFNAAVEAIKAAGIKVIGNGD